MDKEKDSPVLYQEDTQTPTNLDTTAQAPVTKGEDGVILDQYQDQNNQDKYATKPNTTTQTKDSSTGSGLEAALGTEYSWDKKASDRANLDYESSVLESKSNYLSNRQELESQGHQLQEQVAMDQYSKNQSAEKAGWTGGYILDTERQMAYLKQTIQSQMYGQMELQKYGYDTSLAAARLAYDTQKYDLALEYYNTALSRAVSEAEITGYYVSPETSEMLNEYSIASRIMNDETATAEDKARADKILASVYEWFESNGISKQGVETYSHLVEERTHKMSLDKLYEYQNSAQNQINRDEFIKLDENGNKIYTDTGLEILDFGSMEASEIIKYINTSEAARNQYYSRLDTTAYEVENKFTDWCTKNGYIDVDENGKVTNVNNEDFSIILQEYLAENGTNLLQKELNKFEDSDPEAVKDLLSKWDCDIELPDGSTITLSLTPAESTSGGINVGDVLVDEQGNKTFNYKGYYIQGEDGAYLKDCKNLATLTAAIQSNPEMAEILKLLELDPRSESYSNAVSDWMNGLQSILAVGGGVAGGAVGSVIGPIGTIIGAGFGAVVGTTAGALVSGAWDLIDDLFVQGATSQKYKQQVDSLTNTINAIEDFIGESNLEMLNQGYEKYKNLSDKDKAQLKDNEKAQLKYAYQLISGLNNYKEALKYAEMRDSNIWEDPWEYIGDNWKADMTDIWDDGYDFGDVTQTIVTGVVDVAETAVAAVVGGAKWVWKGIKKLKFW